MRDERARIEAAGGKVSFPGRGLKTRALYYDSYTEEDDVGLSMSRSIGDWDAGQVGVIPDPIIDVLDTNTIVSEMLNDNYDIGEKALPSLAVGGADDDVFVFAVCATDGMMEHWTAVDIAPILAHSLFDENGKHPISAVEELILRAASLWEYATDWYRDDITIAVSVLRRPPNH